jgi:hypothetical protein
MDAGIFDWFPRDLTHVAFRLARADELRWIPPAAADD